MKINLSMITEFDFYYTQVGFDKIKHRTQAWFYKI